MRANKTATGIALSMLLFAISARSADRSPIVFFWHFYVVLDQASYEALKSSPEVAALAGNENKHTVAGTREWTGFYLYGRRTYMEFFGSNPLPTGNHEGDIGIGLIVEQQGSLPTVVRALQRKFGDDAVETQSTPWSTSNEAIPWYTATGLKCCESDVLGFWVQETDPGYLAAMHPGARIEQPLSREQYESFRYFSDRLLDDVVGIDLSLQKRELDALEKELDTVGWRVRHADTGFVATGPEMRITGTLANTTAGLRQVDFRLRRSVTSHESTLNSVKIELKGKSGRLLICNRESPCR